MKNILYIGAIFLIAFSNIAYAAEPVDMDLEEGLSGITSFAEGCFSICNSCILNLGWGINTCSKSIVEGCDNLIAICFSRNMQALCVQLYPAFSNSAMGSLNGAIFGLIGGAITCLATALIPCNFCALFWIPCGVISGICAGIATGMMSALGEAELIEPKIEKPPATKIPTRIKSGYVPLSA